ncbi:MAG: hypothetical protein IJZ16_04645 [Clostridia bacterium]|nr:hypothetical protein [Clostridia bacterium]
MMVKTTETIQPGDIFRCEFGDDNNYCNFVFVSCASFPVNCTQITVRYINDSKSFNIYDLLPIDKVTFNVIGREI